MMLTYEEVRAICHEAMVMEPEGFAKLVADYIPQSIIPKLMMDVTHTRMQNHGDLDRAAGEAANFMMGMHVGWLISEKAHGHIGS